jgi:hypothetical protein
MVVGERAVAFPEIIPQSGRGACLLHNARPAFPLFGHEISEERFHDSREVVCNALNLLYEVFTQSEVNRAFAYRSFGAALHFDTSATIILYAHRMRMETIMQRHRTGEEFFLSVGGQR